jgi:hypothetical protein
MTAPVGSWRWQARLLGVTALGAAMGVVALVVLGLPLWAKDEIDAWRLRHT